MTATRDSTPVSGRVGELRTLKLSAFGVSLSVLPDLGGKISSIVWEGKEMLFQNPERPLRVARYGAPYDEYDASGFDDCVPSIGPCNYPVEPWSGIPIPDHGELWSVSWPARGDAHAIHLSVNSRSFPYSLNKTIELVPAPGVRIQYQLSNHSTKPFSFIWSAHPLLAIESGSRIYLPNPESVIVDWSRNGRLGHQFATHSWPNTVDCGGKSVDLSLIGGPELGYVEKLYVTQIDEGWCGVHHPSTGCWVGMVFSTETTPCLGLSINQGGWPLKGKGYFNLGLEPCNGFPDRLDLAVAKGRYAVVQPDETLGWQLELLAGPGSEVPVDRMRDLAREATAA